MEIISQLKRNSAAIFSMQTFLIPKANSITPWSHTMPLQSQQLKCSLVMVSLAKLCKNRQDGDQPS